jgi:hypothetical protein
MKKDVDEDETATFSSSEKVILDLLEQDTATHPERLQPKKVELSLLVHPEWLVGAPKQDTNGLAYGGSAQDDVAATTRWDQARATKIRLLEVRGSLPDQVTCPETNITFAPEKGTVPKKSNYACSACGMVQDVLTTTKPTGKTGPMAAYAVQGYAPKRDAAGKPYSGRFFAAYGMRTPGNTTLHSLNGKGARMPT